MITPITNITHQDAETLRSKPLGTNGMSIRITTQEIDDMQKHLSTHVYKGRVTATFAEKIVRANKVF